MEAASLRRSPPLPEVVRLALVGTLLLLAAIAWLVTDARMDGMDMGPGTDPGSVGFWVTTWAVMMAAMMFPSVAPLVLMHRRIEARRRLRGSDHTAGGTEMLVAGYLLSWCAAGLAAYAVLRLGHELSPAFLAWDEGGRYVAGGVLVAAAAYQLTPVKDVCLRRCRSPFELLLTAWRPGRTGALRMGLEHGAWCVGCCWALMASLIALGSMSIGWMALVAALIALEKLLPWRAVANRLVAVVLVTLGVAVAAVPQDVPGLTVPGRDSGGMPAMSDRH